MATSDPGVKVPRNIMVFVWEKPSPGADPVVGEALRQLHQCPTETDDEGNRDDVSHVARGERLIGLDGSQHQQGQPGDDDDYGCDEKPGRACPNGLLESNR